MKKIHTLVFVFLISLSIFGLSGVQVKANSDPTISLSPISGRVGSTVTVSGSGFAANSALSVTFDGSQVSLSGTTTTDGSGNVPSGVTFTVPASSGTGSQPVVVTDASSNSGSATFTVYTQYLVSACYSTSDSSTPSAPVVLSGTSLGLPFNTTLTTSIQQVWLDDGSSWSVNSQIVAGSGTEQWTATSGTSGTVSSSTDLSPLYYHQYKVSFAVIGEGSTSPAGSNVWENAGSLFIRATPDAGYTFSSWSSSSGSITFNNANSASATATIEGTGAITALFATGNCNCTIVVTQSADGVITPGTTIVNYGGSQAFTITPNTGYSIASLTVDGNQVAAASSYVFTNVVGNHTITATFKLTSASTPQPTSVTVAPTSSQAPALAAMSQYLTVIGAVIVLGAVIIGLVIKRRKRPNIIVLK